MSGKEFEQLLQILPDLAAKYARQRFWKMVRVWSLRAGITALALAGGIALVKLALDAGHPNPAGSALAPSDQPPALVETTPAQNPALSSAATQSALSPYEAPNPEIRQELPLQRTPRPAN